MQFGLVCLTADVHYVRHLMPLFSVKTHGIINVIFYSELLHKQNRQICWYLTTRLWVLQIHNILQLLHWRSLWKWMQKRCDIINLSYYFPNKLYFNAIICLQFCATLNACNVVWTAHAIWRVSLPGGVKGGCINTPRGPWKLCNHSLMEFCIDFWTSCYRSMPVRLTQFIYIILPIIGKTNFFIL